MENLFSNVAERMIDYSYLQPYFDQISLPLELARACLGERLWGQPPIAKAERFVKFVALSTLKRHRRLPLYHDLKTELVDFRGVPDFTLRSGLSWWGGDGHQYESPCVFVSHRWATAKHPDPDGLQLAVILKRLQPVKAKELYLWIDYCCIPQREFESYWTGDDKRNFETGLRSIPDIAKSCDLMIVHSPDYMLRVWCYTELFVWLCKLAEVRFTHNDPKTKLFRSVQTRHLVKEGGTFTNEVTSGYRPGPLIANLKFRGYDGDTDALVSLYKPLAEYCQDMADSANYHLAGGTPDFDSEYLSHLVNFLLRSWLFFKEKECTQPGDKELCIRVLMESVKANE
jgi:hypothetical protein